MQIDLETENRDWIRRGYVVDGKLDEVHQVLMIHHDRFEVCEVTCVETAGCLIASGVAYTELRGGQSALYQSLGNLKRTVIEFA